MTRSTPNFDALRQWLRANRIANDIREVGRFAGGTQNVVLKVELDGRSAVLRCPPEHPRPNSNRTLGREITVLRSLAGTDVPHPRLIAGCEDPSVLGFAFLIMDYIDGINPGQEVSEAQRADPVLRHGQGLAVAEALATLSRIDPSGVGLDGMRKPGSFLAKQVPQWMAVLDSYHSVPGWDPSGLPDVGAIGHWLEEHSPQDAAAGIMHGDFHLSNVLLAPSTPAVAAIIDWEMCTVGDPLLDLGWLIVTWAEEPHGLKSTSPLALLGGLPTRAEMVHAYVDAGGRAVGAIDWYTALAGFKLGIILEGTWVRAGAGKAPIETGRLLHDHAVGLLSLAKSITRGKWSMAAQL
ncbi:phosphotransferase family protein [Rhodococcus opacus]|nr:phosphotransferase family protein [Rhodococcus opacus]